MGGFEKMLKKLEKLAKDDGSDDNDNGSEISDDDDDDSHHKRSQRQSTIENDTALTNSMNPTRWEKACLALNGMIKQVSKVDPDGLDIVCFGGSNDPNSKPNIYRNVKNVKDVERLVTSKLPSGLCYMGNAIDICLNEAFTRGFKKRPCGILILTAGQPDDTKQLEKSLINASNKIAELGEKESPLSITIVHVGDDLDAEEYMRYLDSNMNSTVKNKKTNEYVNIIDTIKDTDIKAAMKEIKGTQSSSGTTGAIIGGFAGAAMGTFSMITTLIDSFLIDDLFYLLILCVFNFEK
jgi:hypothetical protein